MVLFDLESDATEPGATGRHFAYDEPLIRLCVVSLDGVVVAIPALFAAANVDRTFDHGDTCMEEAEGREGMLDGSVDERETRAAFGSENYNMFF